MDLWMTPENGQLLDGYRKAWRQWPLHNGCSLAIVQVHYCYLENIYRQAHDYTSTDIAPIIQIVKRLGKS